MRTRGGGAHRNASPPPRDSRPRSLPRPPGVAPPSPPPPRYSSRAQPRRSATWPMINAAGCGAKSSPSGAPSSPSKGALAGATRDLAAHRALGSPGGGAGQRSRGRGRGRGFRDAAAAAIVPGGIRQRHRRPDAGSHGPGHVRRSEAWLGNRQRLAGVIRAVVAGPPPQAHRRGRGRGRGGISLGHGVAPLQLCVLLLCRGCGGGVSTLTVSRKYAD
jgi:hypothetical protein